MKKFRRYTRLLIVMLLIFVCCVPAFAQEYNSNTVVKTKVTQIVSDEYFVTTVSENNNILTRQVIFKAKILDGEHKGEVVTVTQDFDEIAQMSYYPASVGDKIFVMLDNSKDKPLEGFAQDYVRDSHVYVLCLLFIVSLIVFGKMKGLKTVISLGLTIIAIFYVFIPQLINGYSPIALSLLVSVFIIGSTLIIVIGFNKKSLSAGLGCVGGLVMATILATIMQHVMKITGLINEDSTFLILATKEGFIDLKGIVLASIIIGALGATMDVAISISSSLEEIIIKAPDISKKEIVKSGLNIGRDIMGTMANTLILAYVGSSLQPLLLIFATKFTFKEMINRELIVVEVLQAVCGSIGLLCTIPITTIIVAVVTKRKAIKTQ